MPSVGPPAIPGAAGREFCNRPLHRRTTRLHRNSVRISSRCFVRDRLRLIVTQSLPRLAEPAMHYAVRDAP
jgi:hypothetical protein